MADDLFHSTTGRAQRARAANYCSALVLAAVDVGPPLGRIVQRGAGENGADDICAGAAPCHRKGEFPVVFLTQMRRDETRFIARESPVGFAVN